MKRWLNGAFRDTAFFVLAYTLVTAAGVLFLILRAFRFIRNEGTVPRARDKGLLVVSNHPSYLEAFLLPFLFFPRFLLHPVREGPWSTPDYANILAPWHLFWLRYLHMVPIYRGRTNAPQKNAAAFNTMAEILNGGGTVILFAEGGRTSSGPRHLIMTSATGKELRPLSRSIELITAHAACAILPIWVEGTDTVLPRKKHIPRFWKRQIVIRVGALLEPPVTTGELEQKLLMLADEP